MDIFANPNEPAVEQLLSESGLPIEDITAQHLHHFFGCGSGPELEGVIGLELSVRLRCYARWRWPLPAATPAWARAW